MIRTLIKRTPDINCQIYIKFLLVNSVAEPVAPGAQGRGSAADSGLGDSWAPCVSGSNVLGCC